MKTTLIGFYYLLQGLLVHGEYETTAMNCALQQQLLAEGHKVVLTGDDGTESPPLIEVWCVSRPEKGIVRVGR